MWFVAFRNVLLLPKIYEHVIYTFQPSGVFSFSPFRAQNVAIFSFVVLSTTLARLVEVDMLFSFLSRITMHV